MSFTTPVAITFSPNAGTEQQTAESSPTQPACSRTSAPMVTVAPKLLQQWLGGQSTLVEIIGPPIHKGPRTTTRSPSRTPSRRNASTAFMGRVQCLSDSTGGHSRRMRQCSGHSVLLEANASKAPRPTGLATVSSAGRDSGIRPVDEEGVPRTNGWRLQPRNSAAETQRAAAARRSRKDGIPTFTKRHAVPGRPPNEKPAAGWCRRPVLLG